MRLAIGAEDLVADGVAVVVVDVLEVVDVDHQHADGVAVAAGAGDLLLAEAEEVAAVVEAGEPVDRRHGLDLGEQVALGDLGVVLAALEAAAVVHRGDGDDRGADEEELVGERGREVGDLDQAERQRAHVEGVDGEVEEDRGDGAPGEQQADARTSRLMPA
jgi:hypothetical protein